MTVPPLPDDADPAPEPRTLVDWCTARDDAGRVNRTADRLLMRVARRRTWALHRHVHIVAAFLAANERRPVRTVLATGCGAGLSELFLAALHPEVHFTLTDVDPVFLEGPRQALRELPITNVSVAGLDLLEPGGGDRYDLVTSVEVLEHIDDDQRAARSLFDRAEHHVHLLVPYCSPTELADPTRRRHVWEVNRHHRPGYTHETFAALLDVGAPFEAVHLRNAYLGPEARGFREHLAGPTDDELVAQRVELATLATLDVRDELVDGGTRAAQAIEVLLEIDRSADRTPAARTGTATPR